MVRLWRYISLYTTTLAQDDARAINTVMCQSNFASDKLIFA